jgi:hypothetical protein
MDIDSLQSLRSNSESVLPTIKSLSDDELANIVSEIFQKEVSDEVLDFLIKKHANNFSNEVLEQELSYYFKYDPSLTTKHPTQKQIETIQTNKQNIFNKKLDILTKYYFDSLQEKINKSAQSKIKIIGIKGMDIWKEHIENKQVIVLHDTHTLDYVCDDTGITVNRFLENLRDCSKNTIDVFAEVDFERKGVYEGQRNIHSFLKHIKTDEIYLKSSRRDGESVEHQLRIHYGDMRPMFLKHYNITKYMNALSGIHYYSSEEAIDYVLTNEPPEQFLTEKSLQNFIVFLLNDQKIAKQKSKLSQKHLDLIEKYEEYWIADIKKRFISILDILNDIQNNPKQEQIKQALSDYRQYLSQVLGIPGDIYVLCRMFSKRTQSSDRSLFSGLNSLDISRTILYFGGFHNIRYTNFLRNLGYTKVYTTLAEKDFECVDITDAKSLLDDFCA